MSITKEQKERIRALRCQGLGYTKVARLVGISENTIKSYCRRNGISRENPKAVAAEQGKEQPHFCKYCGRVVVQISGRKEKKFCSDKCRMTWWNDNLNLVNRKAVYWFVCSGCGKEFSVYGNKNRKYCSHECYIRDRFGGVMNEREAV